MAKLGLGTYTLLIAIVFWGVLIGGIVYSNFIVMPVFLGDLPASAVVVNGTYAVNEAPFWMAIHPLVILSTLIALVTNWRTLPRRKLISFSLIIYVLILVTTALYFVPELMAFVDSPKSNIPAAEWGARAYRWQIFSAIRGLVIVGLYFQMLVALVKGERKIES